MVFSLYIFLNHINSYKQAKKRINGLLLGNPMADIDVLQHRPDKLGMEIREPEVYPNHDR